MRYLIIVIVFILIGCSSKSDSIDVAPENVKIYKNYVVIESKGIGVVPCDGGCSTAQAKAMARRAAILDAYRSLTEKIYGIKIDGEEKVENLILKNSVLKSYLEGIIKGAIINKEEFKDGMYIIDMTLRFDLKSWNKLAKIYINNNSGY